MGHHEAGNLAVFLNNRGEVTAYSATGHKLWQVPLPFVGWPSPQHSEALVKVMQVGVTKQSQKSQRMPS